jgi:hypothetical protein
MLVAIILLWQAVLALLGKGFVTIQQQLESPYFS